jgi:opacity protein-like surface antigen
MKALIIIAFLLFVPASLAQSDAPRGEVFGSIGGGKVYDDEGKIGSGVDFGGGVGYRITPKFGIEGQVNAINFKREFFSGVRFEGTAVFTTVNVLYHFSKSKVQPYVLAGYGVSHHRNRSQFPGEPNLPQQTATGLAQNYGAGVKIYLSKTISLRPEVGVFIGSNEGIGTGIEPPISVGRASIAFTYHW